MLESHIGQTDGDEMNQQCAVLAIFFQILLTDKCRPCDLLLSAFIKCWFGKAPSVQICKASDPPGSDLADAETDRHTYSHKGLLWNGSNIQTM